MPSRILIVDDEPAVADLIEAVLVGEGYTVAIARDGAQGLLLARDWRPDLILMDVMLPGVDGGTAIRRLKSDPETADIPIVAMSAGRTIRRPIGGALPRPMPPSPNRSTSTRSSRRSSSISPAAAPKATDSAAAAAQPATIDGGSSLPRPSPSSFPPTTSATTSRRCCRFCSPSVPT